jgi:hypothetical protein
MKKFFLLGISLCLGYGACADGFISSTLSAGYTNFTQRASPGYVFDRSGTDSLSDNLTAIAFDAHVVSRLGVQLCLEILTGFDFEVTAQLVPAFGIGYSFNRLANLTLGVGLLYALMPLTVDSFGAYTGDGAVGPQLEATYWFGDLGLSALLAYYRFVLVEAHVLSARVGISLRI